MKHAIFVNSEDASDYVDIIALVTMPPKPMKTWDKTIMPQHLTAASDNFKVVSPKLQEEKKKTR